MVDGYLAANSLTVSANEGEFIVPDKMTICFEPTAAKPAAIFLSTASYVGASFPSSKGNRRRAISYKPKTDACAFALVPPFVNEPSFP